MNKLPSWNSLLQSLVLIRMGQELGSDSNLSRAIHALATVIINIFK